MARALIFHMQQPTAETILMTYMTPVKGIMTAYLERIMVNMNITYINSMSKYDNSKYITELTQQIMHKESSYLKSAWFKKL